MPGLKIAILTLGTRGDVQPYLALGKAFRQEGHHVTLCTGRNFESLVKSANIHFVPVEADFQAFLGSDVGRKIIRMPFSARKHLKKWVYPMVTEALHTFYALARVSDRVLFNVKTLADHFADEFPEKMIRANVVPTVQPTYEFVNPAFKSLLLPSFLNRFSYKLYDMSIQTVKSRILLFRKDVGLPETYVRPDLPSIYGISTHFLDKPKDFPKNSHFTGFWPDSSQEPLSNSLIDFLEAGKAPLLITFGSMPFNSRINLNKVVKRMVNKLGTRVIVVRGWGITHTEALDNHPDIKVIDAAPFDRLFPRVKAVIHHGGAGTTSTCLQAGVPFFACPVLYPFGDQEFWGTLGYEKGVALKPVPLKKLNDHTLLQKARTLLSATHLYSNSRLLAKKLKAEDGLTHAVRLVVDGVHSKAA